MLTFVWLCRAARGEDEDGGGVDADGGEQEAHARGPGRLTERGARRRQGQG